ncbi:MAG: glycosyltransferase [Candidatus Methylacidiphilales bacterium]|nr:glycosyltransferase [Candidatus Methylacidiphilales bacterium]
MPPAPLVSVLLSVRDGEATLTDALASLSQQSLTVWEAVVMDDGSSDATPVILGDAARKDSRFRVFTRPARGLVASLNEGLSLCRAPLIARMDADDLSHPERLEKQYRWMLDHPDTGVAGCLVAYAGHDPDAHGYRRHVDWLNTLVDADAINRCRFIDSPLANPSTVFRRGLISIHGAYREGDIPEDYDFWLRLLDAGVRMEKVPETLLTWRDSPGRLTRTHPHYRAEAFARLKAEWFDIWWRRHGAGRSVWLWGAGLESRKRARPLLGLGLPAEAWIDIDPKKIGRELYGLPIYPVEQLPSPGQAVVLVLAGAWDVREIILGQLRERGFREGEDAFAFC